jgi:gluconolactonase
LESSMKLNDLIEPGDPEIIASGFEFTEGPIWSPEGALLFSDIPANRIYRWTSEDGIVVWREPSNHANGLTLDRQNRLVICEHGNRRVSRIEADGSISTLADSYDGKRLNSPNDIVVKSDGTIYFTDPPYGIEPDEQEQTHNGLYRISLDGSVELLRDDFIRPNGLAFSSDESVLYVDDSRRRHVRGFDVNLEGGLSNSRVIADMDHPQPGSPDGMKINVEGHLFVAGATGIWIFEPDGTSLGVIVTPERPANCAWGDEDSKSLYITARTSLYRIRVKIPGIQVVARA